jgi:hypothetical protein
MGEISVRTSLGLSKSNRHNTTEGSLAESSPILGSYDYEFGREKAAPEKTRIVGWIIDDPNAFAIEHYPVGT